MNQLLRRSLYLILASLLLCLPTVIANDIAIHTAPDEMVKMEAGDAADRLKEQMVSRLPLDRLRIHSEREPGRSQRVESISWMKAEVSGGDEAEKAVESASHGPSYLRYVIPVAVILAAGTTTYLLFSVRSR